MATTIEFKNVSKRYRLGMTRTSIPVLVSNMVRSALRPGRNKKQGSNVFWALNDVSFTLDQGDALALVGANGAGKTTILKLLAKITQPTSGRITTNGQLSALIELGAGFHPDLSGRENVYLNGSILGLKRQQIDKQFDSIVSFAGLEQFIDTPVKRYSSGMAVRLGFSVAASINPDILLVDEVLAVGDTAFRLKCMNRIQELLKNGTTLIFVSHNMGLVKSVCDKAMYLEKGVSKFFGNTHDAIELYNRALNEQRINEGNTQQGAEKVSSTLAQITGLQVSGVGKDQENVLKTSHKARIDIHYKTDHEIRGARVALRILRSDGIYCCALYSHIDNAQLDIPPGSGVISVSLDPLQLFPGTYSIIATLKNSLVSLSQVYSDWFYVESDQVGYDDMDAVFEPNRAWSLSDGAEAAMTSNPMNITIKG